MSTDKKRKLFYGLGAYVGRVDGATLCAFWPDDPVKYGFSPEKLVRVDLAKSPKYVPLAKVVVDDHKSHGGLTTIGPRFPPALGNHGPSMVGKVYVSDDYFKLLRDSFDLDLPWDPQLGEHDYQYQMALYGAGTPKMRRYHGYHVLSMTKKDDGTTELEIEDAGEPDDAGKKRRKKVPVDLNDPAQVDANLEKGGLTGVSESGPQTGPVFIEEGTAQANKLEEPKLPKASGGL